MLFLNNLIPWAFDTYLRNILNAYFPYLLLFNRQIEVHIQIGNLKVSLVNEISVDVNKCLYSKLFSFNFNFSTNSFEFFL